MAVSTATLLTLTALGCLIQGGCAIKWVRFAVPSYVSRGDDVVLTCEFDLEGEKLYSVKWYKQGKEFYRYVPGDWPPQQAFERLGITVDVSQSSHETVTLRKVTLDAGGRYKCEVLTEAPKFKTLVKSSVMRVVELPQGGPEVTGGVHEYRLGDLVNITCTAPRSIPAPALTWYINGQEAPQDYLIKYQPKQDSSGMIEAKLGLVFRAERWHFNEDKVTLRCTASIQKFYKQEGHHIGVVVHPLKPALLEDHNTGGESSALMVEIWLILLCCFLLHL